MRFRLAMHNGVIMLIIGTLNCKTQNTTRLFTRARTCAPRRNAARPAAACAHRGLIASHHPSSSLQLTHCPSSDCSCAALCSGEEFLPDTFLQRKVRGVKRTLIGCPHEWSHAIHPAFKLTGDGASFRNAPKGQRTGTNFILVFLGTGVRSAKERSFLVARLAYKLHSCLQAFPMRVWMGKDDGKHLAEHIAPLTEEAPKIERDGIEADIPGKLPPWDMCNGVLRKRELETLPNTKKNAGRPSDALCS